MINLREIRISVFYFINVLMLILATFLIMKYHLFKGDPNDIVGIITGLFFVFIILGIIPCIIASIYHIVKAIRYDKIYYKDKHYAEWNYLRNDWNSFIINNFKINNFNEVKFFLKYEVKILIMTFVASIGYIFIGYKYIDYKIVLGPTIIFLLYFIIVIFRDFISMVDHIVFTNCNIILMAGSIIVNGQVYKLDVIGERELIKKEIRNGNIEIEYAVKGILDKRIYWNSKNIKKIIIPIPSGRYEEAEKYINAPFPTKGDYINKIKRNNQQKKVYPRR